MGYYALNYINGFIQHCEVAALYGPQFKPILNNNPLASSIATIAYEMAWGTEKEKLAPIPLQFYHFSQRLKGVTNDQSFLRVALTLEALSYAFNISDGCLLERTVSSMEQAVLFLREHPSAANVCFLNSKDGFIYEMQQETFSCDLLSNVHLQELVDYCWLQSQLQIDVEPPNDSVAFANVLSDLIMLTQNHELAPNSLQGTTTDNCAEDRLKGYIKFNKRFHINSKGEIFPLKKHNSLHYEALPLTEEQLLDILRRAESSILRQGSASMSLEKIVKDGTASFVVFQSKKSSAESPLFKIYSQITGLATQKTKCGSYGVVRKTLKISTGRRAVLKSVKDISSLENHAAEHRNSAAVHSFIESNKERIKAAIGNKLFITRDGKEQFVGIIKIKDVSESGAYYLDEGFLCRRVTTLHKIAAGVCSIIRFIRCWLWLT